MMDRSVGALWVVVAILAAILFLGMSGMIELTNLTDVRNAIVGVQNDVGNLSDEVAALKTGVDLLKEIADLKARVGVLEERGECPEEVWGAPDYDSGWTVHVPPESPESSELPRSDYMRFEHGLDTIDVFVYLVGKTEGGGGVWTQQYSYGRDASDLGDYGVFWTCDLDNLLVHFGTTEYRYKEVRVLIWRLP